MQIINYDPKVHYNATLTIFKENSQMFFPWDIENLSTELKAGSSNASKKFVALDDTQTVLGYIEIEKPNDTEYTWEVLWLAVAKKAQRRGIGSELIKLAIEKIKEFGIDKVFLDTCGCGSGIPAQNFYAKHGFTKAGQVPDYYGTGHPKIIFFKRI
jgi:ribosomal protein S18 acetylase RimI-like enzyme